MIDYLKVAQFAETYLPLLAVLDPHSRHNRTYQGEPGGGSTRRCGAPQRTSYSAFSQPKV